MKVMINSEFRDKLEKNLHIDEKGNIEVGGNLIADGTIGGNSGLAIIHTIKVSDIATVKIITEKSDEGLGGFNFIGYFSDGGPTPEYPCFGNYLTMSDLPYTLVNMIVLKNLQGRFNNLAYIENNPSTGEYTVSSFAYADKTQVKLFTHTLTLTADSKTYTLIYQSTNDLNVDSIADLRTIMEVKAASDSVVLPVCLSDLTATACLQVTTALCKIGTANVTKVTDKVTTK